MPGDQTWRRHEDFVSAPLPDGIVILDLDDGAYFFLSETGTSIWELLQRPCTVDEITAALTSAYDVDRARCEATVRAFLEELAERGLAEELPAGGPPSS